MTNATASAAQRTARRLEEALKLGRPARAAAAIGAAAAVGVAAVAQQHRQRLFARLACARARRARAAPGPAWHGRPTARLVLRCAAMRAPRSRARCRWLLRRGGPIRRRGLGCVGRARCGRLRLRHRRRHPAWRMRRGQSMAKSGAGSAAQMCSPMPFAAVSARPVRLRDWGQMRAGKSGQAAAAACSSPMRGAAVDHSAARIPHKQAQQPSLSPAPAGSPGRPRRIAAPGSHLPG